MVSSRPDLTLHVGDFRNMTLTGDVLVWDPPWNAALEPPAGPWRSVLAFGDGSTTGRIFRTAADHCWPPCAWSFVWDCVSSWWTKNRPLRRHKSAHWFGDVASCGPAGTIPRLGTGRSTWNPRGHYVSSRTETRVSDLFSEPIAALHSANGFRHEKPIEWVKHLLSVASRPGDIIVDPCAGGGTTGIAGMALGRRVLMCEIDRATAVAAWRRITGHQPDVGAQMVLVR